MDHYKTQCNIKAISDKLYHKSYTLQDFFFLNFHTRKTCKLQVISGSFTLQLS